MTKSRSRDEIERIIDNFGYNLLDEFIDHNKNDIRMVIIQDGSGYKTMASLPSILEGHSAEFFHKSNPYTLENISLWLRLNDKNFELCENNIYDGNQGKLAFHCLINDCDEIFYCNWGNMLSGKGCSYCSGKTIGRRNNLKYLIPNLAKEWLESEHGLCPSEITPYANENVYWRCQDCGHEWWANLNNRSNRFDDKTNKFNCPACNGKIVTDKNRLSILFPEISSEWHPTLNGDLTPRDVSFGMSRKVWWICKFNHEWKDSIAHRTDGRGCTKCSFSNGETIIYDLLLYYDIKFIPQYCFDDCKDKSKLRFDFYLVDYNTCIEMQGVQHFEPIDFAGKGIEWAENQFKELLIRDEIKEEYCKNNNIPLIRIPYWEIDNIESIIIQELGL